MKRSGKKTISSIVGLHAYGCDLEDVAKIFARKLGSGAAAMQVEYREINEMGIQVQGDVSEKLEAILANELAQYNIPYEKKQYQHHLLKNIDMVAIKAALVGKTALKTASYVYYNLFSS